MPSKTSLVYPLPNNAITTHHIEGELIIFDERSKQLMRLNETASTIWQMHENDISPDKIAVQLSEIYGLGKQQLLEDTINALAYWQSIGLLGSDNVPDVEEEPDVLSYLKKARSTHYDREGLIFVNAFTILDTRFEVFSSNEELKYLLLPLLAHFEKTDFKTRHTIRIVEENSNYVITDGEMEVGCLGTIEEVVPLVNAHILVTGYIEANCLSVFHAGVISGKSGVVLLSAGSGSGKSTLTAALMCAGENLFTDELAILTYNKKIRPVPGCVGLKEGSWRVIEEFYPDIFKLPTHKRQDGKLVKFIPPVSGPTSKQIKEGENINAVVFPDYSPEYRTSLTRISAADALVMITDAGYYVNQTLNHDSVAELVAWVKEIPAYELRVNNLKEAVNLVGGLL